MNNSILGSIILYCKRIINTPNDINEEPVLYKLNNIKITVPIKNKITAAFNLMNGWYFSIVSLSITIVSVFLQSSLLYNITTTLAIN